MKKKLLLIILGLYTMIGYSQMEGKNEFKVNLPYFIAGLPEVSYERIIDDTSAAGISLACAIDKPENLNTRFVLTPYYRLYFGKGKAKGFFIEGNGAVLSQKGYTGEYDDYGNYTGKMYTGSTTNFGFGAAIGVKFLNKNGYIGEIYGGGGRLFGIESNHNFTEGYPRFGISIGKRF